MNVLIVEPSTPPRAAVINHDLFSMQEVVGGLMQTFCPFAEEVALMRL